MKRSIAVAVTVMAAAGCVSDDARLSLGAQCELTSECEAPLVCRLERCRKECVSTRDCALGLRCVKAQDGLGVCQLPDEAMCLLDSECVPPLVCRTETCTNECAEDRDCVAGQRCADDGEGGMACVEQAEELCIYDSDCPEPLVCNFRQQCQRECVVSTDCEIDEMVCLPHEGCQDGMPCMCRRPCDPTEPAPCPFGFECIACPDGLTCEEADSYCERTDAGGVTP